MTNKDQTLSTLSQIWAKLFFASNEIYPFAVDLGNQFRMIIRLVCILGALVFFACAGGTLTAQADAPEVVQTTFASKYPGAKKVTWGIDRNDSFEAHYKLNGIKYRADFNPNGSWIETERSLDWDDLPKAVQKAVQAEYKKDDIVELEFTDNASKGEFYDVEIDPKGKKKFDVEYRADGSKL